MMMGHVPEDMDKEVPTPRERSSHRTASLPSETREKGKGNVESVGRWRESDSGSTEQMALIF